jgi:hypothetical protein
MLYSDGGSKKNNERPLFSKDPFGKLRNSFGRVVILEE